MKLAALLFLAICTFDIYAADPENIEDAAEVIAAGTYAVPLKLNPPKHPNKTLRAGIEGWVVVNFSIMDDGTTDDIVVISTSIEHYFEREAIRTVSAWTYKPATWDGMPVTQSDKTARLTFRLPNSDVGVSRSFQAKYKRAYKDIQDGDLASAKKLIDKLEASKKMLLTEVCYLDILKVAYWQAKGDSVATLKHLERALTIADEVMAEDLYITLLRQAIIENGKLHNYASALKYYNTLLQVDGNLAADNSIHGVVMRIRQVLDGDTEMISSGEISLCPYCRTPTSFWRHTLTRSSFSIDQVVGEVEEIEIMCGFKSVLLLHNPEAVWNVNKDWGECDIRVFGQEGTTLRLTEFPNDK